jgi:hypothetical protein
MTGLNSSGEGDGSRGRVQGGVAAVRVNRYSAGPLVSDKKGDPQCE